VLSGIFLQADMAAVEAGAGPARSAARSAALATTFLNPSTKNTLAVASYASDAAGHYDNTMMRADPNETRWQLSQVLAVLFG